MGYDYAKGKERTGLLISWILAHEDGMLGIPRPDRIVHGGNAANINKDQAGSAVDLLLTEGLLTEGQPVGEMPHYHTTPNLGRHRDGAVDMELARICAPNPVGAPPGNGNALKSGRYSTRFTSLLAAAEYTDGLRGPYSLDRQRALLAAAIEDIARLEDADPVMLIKAVLAHARVTIMAAALDATHPHDPPPDDGKTTDADEWRVKE